MALEGDCRLSSQKRRVAAAAAVVVGVVVVVVGGGIHYMRLNIKNVMRVNLSSLSTLALFFQSNIIVVNKVITVVWSVCANHMLYQRGQDQVFETPRQSIQVNGTPTTR